MPTLDTTTNGTNDPYDPFDFIYKMDPATGLTKVARRSKAGLLGPEEKEEDMPPTEAREGFTFGCDPEVFIKNKEGTPVPAEGIIPGTKAEPHYMGDDVFLQVDGFAAEFNITPASNFADFNRRIEKALEYIKKLLPEGHELLIEPWVRFDPEVFAAASDNSKELGCHPDCNAWTGKMNPPPCLPDDPCLRTASGHLHIGWTQDADLTDVQHILACRDLVKQLDWFVGAWSLKLDKDDVRRKLYGQAGACRYKPYGVEYRVPSNFWITTRERRLMVWNRMMEAINQMTGKYMPDKARGWNDYVIDAINGGKPHPNMARDLKYPIHSLNAGFARF